MPLLANCIGKHNGSISLSASDLENLRAARDVPRGDYSCPELDLGGYAAGGDGALDIVGC